MRYVSLLLFVFLIACGNSKQNEIDKLVDEVMVVHDEVMPVTDKLYTMRLKLQDQVKADSTQDHTETLAIIADLEKGEEAMFDWMRNFNLQYEGETEDDTYSYFIEKKKSIEAVSAQMKDAQKRAEAALK